MEEIRWAKTVFQTVSRRVISCDICLKKCISNSLGTLNQLNLLISQMSVQDANIVIKYEINLNGSVWVWFNYKVGAIGTTRKTN